MEQWKDIEGYEGLYQISSYGRVKSLGNDKTRKEKILTPHPNEIGYQRVGLRKNGKQKWERIHRLVAKAFIPNPNNYPQINHKDECKTNNAVENLEWCTSQYNNTYNGRHLKVGRKVAKTREKRVYLYSLNKELISEFSSLSNASKATKINKAYISLGCATTNKGYIWSYTPL